jgi:threonine dehydrogenase-like Zn-dependent dehydrogenase
MIMKSLYAVLVPPERTIELRERELEPRENQVLLRILASGICRGDLNAFRGRRSDAAPFGHEPVGQVVTCGPWVRRLRKGDWVVGEVEGAFAAHALGWEDRLNPAPEEIGEFGGLAEPLKCVTTVLRAAAPDLGDVVAVAGCGFMGLSSLAMLAGGCQGKLIALDKDSTRRALALQLGAVASLDPASADPVEQLHALTNGEGADVALDWTGNREGTTMAAHLLRKRGRLVAASGYLPEDPHLQLYSRALTIICGHPTLSPDQSDDYRRALDTMQRVRPMLERLITHRFPLSAIQQAFETALGGAGTGYLKGIVVNDLA